MPKLAMRINKLYWNIAIKGSFTIINFFGSFKKNFLDPQKSTLKL